MSFTTGALPSNIPLPTFTLVVPPGGQLYNPFNLYKPPAYADVPTDLTGNIMWYFYPDDRTGDNTLTRPLTGRDFLTIQDGTAWNTKRSTVNISGRSIWRVTWFAKRIPA